MRCPRVCAAGGFLAVALAAAQAESVILKQSFNDFDLDAAGVAGDVSSDGGAWRDLRKMEKAPRISDQEYFLAKGESAGKSIKLTRDSAVTADFWLIGVWSTGLESGKARVSFRVLRDSEESGLSVHFGDAEKDSGANTMAVNIGNRQGGEVLKVMDSEGAWQGAGANPTVGTWAQIVFEIDFSTTTYSVRLDGILVAENVPFTMKSPAVKLSFLPAAPEGNVTYIDDVEVVALD